MRQQLNPRRLALRSGGLLVAAALVVGIGPGTASAAPTNPTDSQIAGAQSARDQAAAAVGSISAQLAAAQASADTAHQQAQIALQDYEDKQAAAQQAQADSDAAVAASDAADAARDQGQTAVDDFARSSYMGGTTNPGFASLLTSGSPSEFVERAALLEAAGAGRSDVLDQLTVLQGQAEDAQTQAAGALSTATTLQAEAEQSLASAQAQESSARAQADTLSAQSADLQAQLTAAQQTLYGLQGAREVARQQAAAAAAAAAAVPARSTPVATGSSSSRPSSSSGGGATTPVAPAPTGGSAGAPSASAAATAIAAARSQLGVLYSWGGGNASGPTLGISPDEALVGFDCSGLMEYAYAQAGIRVGGTSRAQWSNNSDKQVDAADLQPGDMMFWASGSASSSIYHVAMYIGGNQMIEAPDRGQRVKISSVRFGGDYFGAVRPSA
ncbi:Cell wall-associated hydrolase, NlpC family [Klenkia soli]|uniref:Cell wall-associated hydrolase, NlpC family n=1 Tax=Klenkia soli TaxID=1052260 RepID=A0A1H0S125_9ACTN|nr:C40 family peptidase [Klenkia soli]SDP35531.1 Cell wall-associated hydrolase, NlpC family [Klenkia soli]